MDDPAPVARVSSTVSPVSSRKSMLMGALAVRSVPAALALVGAMISIPEEMVSLSAASSPRTMSPPLSNETDPRLTTEPVMLTG